MTVHHAQRRQSRWPGRIAWLLAGGYLIDRLTKLALLAHAFGQPPPAKSGQWPTVSLAQPITRGVCDLRANLLARLQLDYPAEVQHLWACDASDHEALTICRNLIAEHPTSNIHLVTVGEPNGGIATKIIKLQAILPTATGDVIGFVDDDVAPRTDALRRLVPQLDRKGVGAAFGLPCYTNWRTPWSSLMSGFVNANMAGSFIALAYLTNPFRITGHIALFRRDAFTQAGGLNGMEQQIDDDFELARRLQHHGYRAVQAPVVYDISNDLPSLRAYHRQLTRWFVLPGQSMFPSLTPRQRNIAFLTAGPALVIPPTLLILALLGRRRSSWSALAVTLGTFGASYAITERRYLHGRMPSRRWPLLPILALLTPAHALATMASRNEVEWRGQRLRITRDGRYEVLHQ